MNEGRVRIGDRVGDTVIAPEELDAFIAYMNDNSHDGMDARLGKEIEFVERNELPGDWLLSQVGYFAKDDDSPLLAQLEKFGGAGSDREERMAEFIRALHLQLRDHFRGQFGIAPLTSDQRQSFPAKLVLPAGFPRKRTTLPGQTVTTPTHVITAEEAQGIARYVQKHFPELVKYYRAVCQYSEVQGYVQSNEIARTGFVERVLIASAELILDTDRIGHVQFVKEFLKVDLLSIENE